MRKWFTLKVYQKRNESVFQNKGYKRDLKKNALLPIKLKQEKNETTKQPKFFKNY